MTGIALGTLPTGLALSELMARLDTAAAPLPAELVGNGDAVVTSVTHDSRAVGPGTLFVCVRGARSDGHGFANAAVAAGATGLVVDHRLPTPAPQILVDDTRAAMGPIAAAAFHGFPGRAMTLVGITGTNGKTTTAHLLESILHAAGRRVAVIGTLTQTRTTPEATDLQQRLAELRDAGTEIVVMEVTSHALELHRVAGLHFQVALFTNLSQDHLDFHPTMEAYFRAKAKLFTPQLCDVAIVNADDPRGELLVASALIPTTRIHLHDAGALVLGAQSSRFTVGAEQVVLHMAGPFNVMNALQAAAAARAVGVDDRAIAAGLGMASVPGRFERIDEGQPFTVVVDFAHTPDGLERVLEAARATLDRDAMPQGRITVLFGCGGDRDRGKRPLMGAAAAAGADRVVLTADNSRSERTEDIVAEILTGIPEGAKVRVILDRREAIATVTADAGANDIVVLAGKGHEQGQDIGGVVTPFDDRDEARAALRALGHRRSGSGE